MVLLGRQWIAEKSTKDDREKILVQLLLSLSLSLFTSVQTLTTAAAVEVLTHMGSQHNTQFRVSVWICLDQSGLIEEAERGVKKSQARANAAELELKLLFQP